MAESPSSGNRTVVATTEEAPILVGSSRAAAIARRSRVPSCPGELPTIWRSVEYPYPCSPLACAGRPHTALSRRGQIATGDEGDQCRRSVQCEPGDGAPP